MSGLPMGATLTVARLARLPGEAGVYGHGADLEDMEPRSIVSFSGLRLVRLNGDDNWYMGNLDQQDGAIVCLGPYGPDLAQATRIR
jgi:hypothetical protein